MFVAALAAAIGGCTSSTSSSSGALVEVVYRLHGTARGADLTYTDGSGNIQQATHKSVPLVRLSDGFDGLTIHIRRGAYVQFSAQNIGDSGDLNCTILANGIEINTGHSSGGFAIVNCAAHVP